MLDLQVVCDSCLCHLMPLSSFDAMFVPTVTTVLPLSALVLMISSLLDSSLIVSLSLLSKFGYGSLGLKGLVHLISFIQLQWMCQWYDDLFSGVQLLFLFALNILFSLSVSLLIKSLKCAFSFISLKK